MLWGVPHWELLITVDEVTNKRVKINLFFKERMLDKKTENTTRQAKKTDKLLAICKLSSNKIKDIYKKRVYRGAPISAWLRSSTPFEKDP